MYARNRKPSSLFSRAFMKIVWGKFPRDQRDNRISVSMGTATDRPPVDLHRHKMWLNIQNPNKFSSPRRSHKAHHRQAPTSQANYTITNYRPTQPTRAQRPISSLSSTITTRDDQPWPPNLPSSRSVLSRSSPTSSPLRRPVPQSAELEREDADGTRMLVWGSRPPRRPLRAPTLVCLEVLLVFGRGGWGGGVASFGM